MSRPIPSAPQPPTTIGPHDSDAQFSVSCLDFLLIELVPLAQRIADQLHAREQSLRSEFRNSKIFQRPVSSSPASRDGGPAPVVVVTDNTTTAATTSTAGAGAGGAGAGAGAGGQDVVDDELREATFWRLDNLGYRVGQGLVERFSASRPRPLTPLDSIKFICKDLWTLLFRKQIDNLKTNHRGVFVLSDTRFPPVSRMSVDRRAGPKAASEALRRAQTYLYFPCGVIRGALQGLGLDVTVTANTTEIPTAQFQIQTRGAKA